MEYFDTHTHYNDRQYDKDRNEVLKKIFMMLDKAVSEKQEQREVMAKNPNITQH